MPRRKSVTEDDPKPKRGKRAAVVDGPDEDGDDEPGADVDFDEDIVNPLLKRSDSQKPRGRK